LEIYGWKARMFGSPEAEFPNPDKPERIATKSQRHKQ